MSSSQNYPALQQLAPEAGGLAQDPAPPLSDPYDPDPYSPDPYVLF